MITDDDRPRTGRVASVCAALRRMNSRAAVKWSALTVGGSVGAVAGLIVIETIVRWLSVVVEVCASLIRWFGA